MYRVIKRNGEKAPLDITKIRKVITTSSTGLDVNPLTLESSLTLSFRNDITTKEIQQEIINCALKLTSVEQPDWRILAGRLLVYNLYKEAILNRGGVTDYVKFVHLAVEKGLYDKKILDYTDEELGKAQTFLVKERDDDFDYAGANLLINRYLISEEGKAFELPQEAFLTISLLLASNEENRLEVAKQFYDAISLRKISLATPLLSNLRKPNGNLSSCFIVAMDDNIESIFYVVNQIAQISKNGGGVGVNISRIRANGADIKGTPNASGGVIPWVRILNDTAVAVNQLGKRAGAVTVALDVWHHDIEQFLELQTENGDQRRKAFDIFPQVVLPDLFMQRVEENASWTLFDPHEIRSKFGIELAELWGSKFEEAYLNLELDPTIKLKKVVGAKEIMKHIMKSQVETGMPYIFFKDTVNKTNPNQHDGMIGSGNLCVAPETKVLTDKGHITIGDHEGDVVNVWNGEEFSETTIRKTGENQELIAVELSNGETIECTSYHHFYIQQGFADGKIQKVCASELRNGDKLIKFNLPVIEGDMEFPYAYTHGFFCGDGTVEKDIPIIYLYGEKIKLRDKLEYRAIRSYKEGDKRMVVRPYLDICPKFEVPNNTYTIRSRLNWLAGLLDSDGCVARNGTNESLQITSVDKGFLLEIRLMLQTLGIDSKVIDSLPERQSLMPDGKGGLKLYDCRATYRLLISSSALYKLAQLGLQTHRLEFEVREPQRNAEQFIKVIAVVKTGRISDTYCFTESKRNMGMFNGVLTGQCVESFSNFKPSKYVTTLFNEHPNLPRIINYTEPGLVHTCNLVSINLANVGDKELEKVCSNAVRILDNTIDITEVPIMEGKLHNNRYRTIGVGSMGLADYLAKRNVTYSTSHEVVNKLFENIAYFSVKASMELAKERGKYEAFEGSEWSKGIVFGKSELTGRWAELIADIKQYGIRNSQILAIAPNTSSSLLQGCTASILPIFSKFYIDKNSKGATPICPPFIGSKFWYYQENKNINQKTIVEIVSIIQGWTDTGISMELIYNFNNDISAREIYETIALAWKSQIKTIYYTRSIQKTVDESCVSCAN